MFEEGKKTSCFVCLFNQCHFTAFSFSEWSGNVMTQCRETSGVERCNFRTLRWKTLSVRMKWCFMRIMCVYIKNLFLYLMHVKERRKYFCTTYRNDPDLLFVCIVSIAHCSKPALCIMFVLQVKRAVFEWFTVQTRTTTLKTPPGSLNSKRMRKRARGKRLMYSFHIVLASARL